MISELTKQMIFQDKLNGKSTKEIAESHGISKASVYRIISKLKEGNNVEVAHDLELRSLKRDLLNHKARYRHALDKVKELQRELDHHKEFTNLSSILIPTDWKIKPILLSLISFSS